MYPKMWSKLTNFSSTSNRLAEIWKGDFSTAPRFDLLGRGGSRRRAYSIARSCVPISSPLTHNTLSPTVAPEAFPTRIRWQIPLYKQSFRRAVKKIINVMEYNVKWHFSARFLGRFDFMRKISFSVSLTSLSRKTHISVSLRSRSKRKKAVFLPEMASPASSGRLQNAIKNYIKVRKTSPKCRKGRIKLGNGARYGKR